MMNLQSRKLVEVTLGTVRIQKSQECNDPFAYLHLRMSYRIQQSNNETLRRVFVRYFRSSEALGRVSLDTSKYEVSDDLRRFIEAVEGITGRRFISVNDRASPSVRQTPFLVLIWNQGVSPPGHLLPPGGRCSVGQPAAGG